MRSARHAQIKTFSVQGQMWKCPGGWSGAGDADEHCGGRNIFHGKAQTRLLNARFRAGSLMGAPRGGETPCVKFWGDKARRIFRRTDRRRDAFPRRLLTTLRVETQKMGLQFGPVWGSKNVECAFCRKGRNASGLSSNFGFRTDDYDSIMKPGQE